MTTTPLILNLQSALLAHARGELGELELIAIILTISEQLRAANGDAYGPTHEETIRACESRVAEIHAEAR